MDNGASIGARAAAAPWPPEQYSSASERIPYLINPPDVVNISIGRQLFVDDMLISSLSDSVELKFHQPEARGHVAALDVCTCLM